MSTDPNIFNEALEAFKNVTKKPELFLNVDDNLVNETKVCLKRTYDTSKNEEIQSFKSSALPQLIIKDFDVEQIWQQIELQNDSVLTRALASVSKVLVNKDTLRFKNLETHSESEASEADDDVQNEASESGKENDSDIESEEKSEEESLPDENVSKKYGKSSVDDQFFKLSEMENFLKAEEKKMNEPDSGNDSEDSQSDEESVNLFEEEDDEEDDPTKIAKYKDFFVEKTKERPVKKNKFLAEMDSENSDLEDADKTKSTFELRKERLNERIQELEENAVGEKQWQLKGEITAESRPQNSLLAEVVDFDMTTRPAPVITEQVTMQLDDIIKRRIKDKVFDSVQRKAKPVETPLEFKKKLVLDQEKSKESLANIYEKDYLAQKAALDPENAEKEEEVPELHKEIDSMMTDLFYKLDSLSNFHFTPKPAIAELKIVTNMPAISIEEVAPVAVSDAALLAPEEIKHKTKGEALGKGERTATDKKRERRKKKIKQKMHSKLQEKNDKQNKKGKDTDAIKKLTRNKNIEKMDESGKTVKSSKAFFTQLQEEVEGHIKSRVDKNSRKKNKNNLDAKKIKL